MTPSPEKKVYIERNRPEDLLFKALKGQGIRYIEDLCGKVWTDYNLHDPGITILEQCCYVMTEMAYRAGFDVADILADETGQINHEKLALYPAHEIFPSQALTPVEYEHLIFDAVPGIDNVWVEPVSDTLIDGLYRIRYRIRDQVGENRAEEILRAVLDVFCENRNLCEDVLEIHSVENQYFSLHAEIEVKGDQNPARMLAWIYNQCADVISPGMAYESFDSLISQGRALEEIFTGPRLKHGFMDHSRSHKRPGYLNVTDLSAQIRSIPGVIGVKSLFLEDEKTKARECEILALDDLESAPCLRIPKQSSMIKVKLYKKKRQLYVGMGDLERESRTLAREGRQHGLSRSEIQKSRQKIQGRFSHLGAYQSIMSQFPNAYGINEFGVPPSYPAKERAKAKQLKAYLLFFEQPMINFMENLAQIPRLFSIDSGLDRTSFSKLIDDDNAPKVEQLYRKGKSACRGYLDKVTRRHDAFYDRRNRVLDYLLSLYGERFSQNALGRFNYYYSQTGLSLWLIRNKIRFLKYLPEVSRRRAAGFNYLARSWNTENVEGLKMKISLLLGFQYHHSRSLTIAFTKHGLELIPDEDLSGVKKGAVEIQYVVPGDIQGKMAVPFKKLGFSRMKKQLTPGEIRKLFRQIVFLKNNLLNQSFMVNGLEFKNYRIGRFTDRSWQLIFRPYKGARWCYLGSFSGFSQALEAANHLRYFIKTLNIMSEGVHLVDHLLLRSSGDKGMFEGVPGDFFSSRISLVFPSWPARCTNGEFRKLVGETVGMNAPAHVAADIYWLGFQEMLSFEILFHDWLAQKSKSDGPDTDEKSIALIRFLMDHSHCKGGFSYI